MPIMLGGSASENLSRLYKGNELLVGGECGFQPISLSYDFSNKTISQIKSDGWTFYSGENVANINSNGITGTASRSENTPHLYNYTFDLSGFNKIEFSMTVYQVDQGWGSNCSGYLIKTPITINSYGCSNMGLFMYTPGTTYSGYNGAVYGGCSTQYNIGHISGGTFIIKVIVEKATKKCTCNVRGTDVNSLTLTDAEITSIEECVSLEIHAGHDTGENRVKSLTLDVS